VVQTSTLPEDDLDGNAPDSRNLGQADADKTFSRSPQALSDDAALDQMEAGEREGDGDRSMADATPEERREMLANQEAAGDDIPEAEQSSMYSPGGKQKEKFGAKLLAGSKRFGPSGGIIGILIGSFMGSSVILAPGSLLVAIEKAITNDSSDSTRTNIVFRRAYIAKLFSADKSKGNTKIEKEMTEMSADEKAAFEKEGFKVTLSDGETGTIDNMKTPGGEDLKNGSQYDRYANDTLEGRRATSNVFSERSEYFNSDWFKENLDRFGAEKGKRLTGSEEPDPEKRKAAIDQSFDQNTQIGESPTDDVAAREAKITDSTTGEDGAKISDKVGEISKDVGGKLGLAALAATPVSAACVAYNVSRLTTATIKAKWVYDLVSFAYPFVRAAAQIEDQGNIEPSVVENLANRLTWFDSRPLLADGTTNPQYNKTALDSQGLQMAIYGDYTGLTDFTQKFTSWGWMVGVSSLTTSYVKTVRALAGGKDNVKSLCNGARAIQTAGLAACLTSIIGAVICGIGAVAIPAAEKALLPLLVAELAKPALHFLATVDLSSALEGEGAGDALAAGLGLLLSGSTLGAAMIPAASGVDGLNNIKSFISKTDEPYYMRTTQLAIDDAKRNPWDASNQYSFMGQLSTMLNPYVGKDGTLFSKIANLSTVVGESLQKIPGTTANALFSQPSNMTLKDALGGDPTANRVAKCKDPELAPDTGIGISCDWSGRPIGYTSSNVLDGLDKVVNGSAGGNDILTSSVSYMTTGKPEDRYIDPDTGAITQGKDFDYYVKYCVKRNGPGGKGMMPLGSTDGKITDDDYEWSDGSKCTPQSGNQQQAQQLDYFSTYYNWCYVQFAVSKHAKSCAEPTSTTTQGNGDVCSLLNNPHIHYEQKTTEEDLKKLCAGQVVASYCSQNQNIKLNPELIKALTTNASKYDVTINNFGFVDDRKVADDCQPGKQHWKGNAVDITKIKKLDGSGEFTGAYGGAATNVVSNYATDFVATLSPNRGGVGQKDHGVHPVYPAGTVGADGYKSFDDGPGHLHIDVRDRTNNNGI
jgi:hypothetical protein